MVAFIVLLLVNVIGSFFVYLCFKIHNIMTTITINERTKAGKTLLELAKLLSVSNKGVSIDEGIDKELILEEEKSVYNPKFVAKIKLAEKQIKEGKTTTINTESIWESIQ